MLKETFSHQFMANLHDRTLLKNGERCIVAVSGGIDSMVLLDLMVKAQSELHLNLAIAHVNHNLRGEESDGDRKFVETMAHRYSVPFYTLATETRTLAGSRKQSVQETARELRYNFFAQLRSQLGFEKIATAHNANDNAETVLFHLLRGSGLKGLSGIPLKREDEGIIRPLLFASREHIVRYALENNIEFREDSSNKKTEYSRNFLRHEIFPAITSSINPNVVETLNRNAELYSLADAFIRQETVK